MDILHRFIRLQRVDTRQCRHILQVLRNKHGAHFPHVNELLRAVIYSKPVGRENQKNEKWLKLTTDCCK